MPEWLPKLTWPDFAVFAFTVFLCLAASRVSTVGDFIGKLFLPKAPAPKKPEAPSDNAA